MNILKIITIAFCCALANLSFAQNEMRMIDKSTKPMAYQPCKKAAFQIADGLGLPYYIVLDDPNPNGTLIGFLINIPTTVGKYSVQCVEGKLHVRRFEY